jgi:O-antigen/teichoic acid export membrane protein
LIRRLQNTLKDSDFKEILTKGFSFLLLRFFGALVGYVFTLFVTNTFGADIYGLIALGFSLFMIVSVFGRLGLDINILKFFSQESNTNESGIFFKSIIKSVSFSSILAIIIYWFREELVLNLYQDPKPELIPYLSWILVAVPFWNIAMICASFLRAKKMNRSFAFLENPSRFLFSLIFLLVIYLFKKEPLIIVKTHFFGILVTALISLILVFNKFKFRAKQNKVNSWKFVRKSLPMLFSSAMLIILGMMDTQIMGIYESKTDVGIYNVSLKIATLTGFCLQAVNSILAPKIAKSYAEGNGDYKRLIAFSTKLIFLITSIVVFFIIILRKLLLGLFGDIFINGEIILLIFCIGQIINSFSGSVGVILQMIGKQKVYQNFVLAALLLNLVLTLILTPLYGGVGAAISTVFSMAFWNIGSALYLKRKMNIISYYNFK